MATTSRHEPSGVPAWVEPMLAKPNEGPLPSGSQWSYEDKLDGFRCCARVSADGAVILTSRAGQDFTPEFAALTEPLAEIFHGRPGVLDGEIVAYNAAGEIDFQLLGETRGRHQGRHRTPTDADIDLRFMAFDLLRLGTTDLVRLHLSYDERRHHLAELPMPDPFRVSIVRSVTYDRLRTDRLTPEMLLQRTGAAGFEGLVAKTRRSPYRPGTRSDAWLKHPLKSRAEVLICGYRPGQRGLTGSLGSLVLGAHDPIAGDLVYVGNVGTGWTTAQRAALLAMLRPLERRHHPFAAAPPREDVPNAVWVEPRLVGEVEYRKYTRLGRLRHASWRGLRDDVAADDVVVPEVTSPATTADPTSLPAPAGHDEQRMTVQVNDKRVTLSNLDKVLYPADGYTKGEVISYYTHVADVLLPHLRDRPITVVRWPDGVEGQGWFAKNTPPGAPDWLRTARLSGAGSRGSGDPVDYPLVDDLAALVWLANLAALELHVPQWTVDAAGNPHLPDRLVLDLDPGEGTSIVECCRVAERLRDLLVADGFTTFATTSGSKGMQLYASIAPTSADAPSVYAKRLAVQLARETPDLVTAVMAKARRQGRVFVDWSQNSLAKTTIAPYSLRGREHPTVATPVTWDEVARCRRATQLVFTADDVLARIVRLGDLLAELNSTRAPLSSALGP
ncbi:MAG TPA: DNA ligase D [Pseudonocardiaceae bacterium]|nr:DNA ligase D [Pseudonocardiaceae bacterium]